MKHINTADEELAEAHERIATLERFLLSIVEDGKYQHWEFCRKFVDEAKRLLGAV